MTGRNTIKLAFLCLLALAAPPSVRAEEPLEYRLDFEAWNTHLMDIAIHVRGLDGAKATFAIPYWAPGVYIAEEFATYVQDFRAEDNTGAALPWRKTDGQTWQVDLQGKTEVVVHYRIYANGLPFRGSQYDERHASMTGAAVWMYLVAHKERPIRLRIGRSRLPASWKIATGLSKLGELEYTAADYDSFADCPIEISDFVDRQFVALGTRYHVVVHNEIDNQVFTPFVEQLRAAVEKGVVPLLAGAVGGARAAPFPEYWFLIHVSPLGFTGAGVEHSNSTMIVLGSDWNDRGPTDHDFLTNLAEYKVSLATHEFFHAWNAKRLRPLELGPFDYSQPVHTESLWISEGLTDYYTDIAMLRAGLWKPDDYLGRVGRIITSYEAFPGLKVRSLAETSWDTWFGFRGGGAGGFGPSSANNLDNTSYSYYDGGQLVGILLDLEIRQATKNRKSLDDWMALMYRRYAAPKPGFRPEDAIDAATEVAGRDMREFFARYVTGKDTLPFADFAYAGLKLEASYSKEGWAGLEWDRSSRDAPMISNVIPGGPAERDGLDRGDILLACNGKSLDAQTLKDMLAASHSGDIATLTIERFKTLRTVALRLESDPNPTYSLRRMEHPTELQSEIYGSMVRSDGR